jgi:hypothetical protein
LRVLIERRAQDGLGIERGAVRPVERAFENQVADDLLGDELPIDEHEIGWRYI